MAVALRSPLATTQRIGAHDRGRDLRGWLAAARWHGLWIALWSIVGWVGTLAAPILLDHPFVLMLLAPRALFVAMAADSVNIVAFVLLGTLRLGATDASYFIVGRRFPRLAARVRPSGTSRWTRYRTTFARWGERLCSWICGHGAKAAAVLFFRPNGKFLAVAGAYGVSARVAGLSSVLGTAIYLFSFHLGIGLLF